MAKYNRNLKKDQASIFELYEKINVVFPVCLQSKNGTEYFRYWQDGRFECINKTLGRTSIVFGSVERELMRIESLTDYLRVIITRLHSIEESEFIKQFDELITDGYAKFYSGESYSELKENKEQEERGFIKYDMENYGKTNEETENNLPF